MKSLYTLILIVAFSLVALPGCSLLGDPIADKVADAVDRYCEEPQGARDLYRATINEELASEGHTIAVVCNGDTPPETSSLMPFDHGHAVAFVATGPPFHDD